MRNHYHAIFQPGEVPLSRMMQQLNSTYCQWWNRRHNRVGHVLQGRFAAYLVDTHVYFLRAVRYVLRNPIKQQLISDPAEWRWSSYRATVGLETTPAFLHLDTVWSMFTPTPAAPARLQFVEFVAAADDDAYPAGPLLYGADEFKNHVSALVFPHRKNPDFVCAERFAVRPPLAALLADARHRAVRAAAMRDAFLVYAYTLREIANAVGLTPSAVWRQIQLARPWGQISIFE